MVADGRHGHGQHGCGSGQGDTGDEPVHDLSFARSRMNAL
jgi:hypothetical protein